MGGSFAVRLEPGSIYSLTTTTGQHKGQTAIPAPAAFPSPYQDDFESYGPGKMAKYFSDQAGIFEVAERGDGGKCLRQTIARRGIDWQYYPNPDPYTILGDVQWRDGEVACDALVERAGEVAIFGRIAKSMQDVAHPQPPYAYGLKASTNGRWVLKAHAKTLAAGRVPFAADRWHRLATPV